MVNNTHHYFTIPSKKLFDNCSIRVLGMPYAPYVIDSDNGVEVEILKQIGDLLGLHFKVTVNKEAAGWGEFENESWTGALGNISRGEFALGVGNLGIDYKYLKDFDFTNQHGSEHLVWIAPIAEFVPKWRTLFLIFPMELWCWFLASFLITGFIFYIFSKFTKENQNYNTFGSSMFSAYRIFIAVPAVFPDKYIVRIFFMGLAILNIFIGTMYTSALVFYLKNPVREFQIKTVSDVIESRLDIGGLENYREYFENASDTDSNIIYERFQIENDSAVHWLKSVAVDRDTCSIFSQLFVQYTLVQKDNILVDYRGLPKIYILPKVLLQYPLNFILQKGFPLIQQFNHIIERLKMSGILVKYYKVYIDAINKVNSIKHKSDVSSLQIENIQGPISILIFGYLLGLLAFIFEWMCYKCCQAKINKRNKLKRK